MDGYKRLFYTLRRDLLLSINSMRLSEVWMDGYKRLFYTHRREILVSINSGYGWMVT